MGINLLTRYVKWYWKPHEKVLYMSWFSANAAKGKYNSPWNSRQTKDVVGTDMFTLHNKYNLCIVDYHSKFPVIKKMEYLSADSLILACKIFFFQNMVCLRK